MPIEYLAGIVDGEGHFCRPKNKNGQGRVFYQSRMIVTNTHRPLLEAIEKTYGGKVRDQKDRRISEKGWKPLWFWVLTGPKCEELARRLRPHLIIKAEQVKRVLEYTPLPNRRLKENRHLPKHV